ncbi:class I SAM-dependent methyltransferase [Mycolicibacterium nivoides]|uniref:Class I SAM-dependent methyltransferase n=1 Tax=Mycolicibacterium nivoides TaxID=2487344 RepID=A0ABW9L458_9MYCO
MAMTVPTFNAVQASLWLTLCGRALDNRLSRPILGDNMADEVVRKVDFDYTKLHIPTSSAIYIAHRAKKLDEIAQRFIARHPDAVGLDLGAGLDSRALRITPPPTVDWYDVDFPEVVGTRPRMLPHDANPHPIGADLIEPTWLDTVPTDRPAVIVADGLIAFLSEDEMRTMVCRIIEHFPSGEIAFNGYSKFAVWAQKRFAGAESIKAVTRFPGFDDPRYPERWHPKLKLVKEILCTREPEVARFPVGLRLMNRLTAPSTAVSRRGNVVLHYAF